MQDAVLRVQESLLLHSLVFFVADAVLGSLVAFPFPALVLLLVNAADFGAAFRFAGLVALLLQLPLLFGCELLRRRVVVEAVEHLLEDLVIRGEPVERADEAVLGAAPVEEVATCHPVHGHDKHLLRAPLVHHGLHATLLAFAQKLYRRDIAAMTSECVIEEADESRPIDS